MNLDSAFTIGSSHPVCQDYAITDNDSESIIICDGCSSSENTDIGSRLLALCIRYCLKEYGVFVKEIVIEKMKMYSQLLQLKDSVFDSTLMVVKKNGYSLNINIIGDGILVVEKEKSLIINDFICENSCPPYLSYNLNEERKKNIIHTDKIKKARFTADKNEKSNLYCLHGNINEVIKELGYDYSFDDSIFLTIENIKSITLFSDGIHSFIKKDEMGVLHPIDFKDVIFELMDFKSTTGKFVQRRLNRFEKDCKKRGWEHYDDLSMATIYLKED